MTHYIDASVVVAFIIDQPQSEIADAWIRAVPQIAVSSFVIGETASAVSRLVRMGQTSEAEGSAALAALDIWVRQRVRVIESQDLDVRTAGTFVRQFDLALRLPDAIHIALAHRTGLGLVTFDTRMAAAATRLGVAVGTPA